MSKETRDEGDADLTEPAVERADFAAVTEEAVEAGSHSLDMILDIPVTVAVEIGRTRIPISELLKLNPGSVVELDRLAGEPMDVTVNGTLIARGEVVVMEEKFGVRLTDVVSASERVRKLK